MGAYSWAGSMVSENEAKELSMRWRKEPSKRETEGRETKNRVSENRVLGWLGRRPFICNPHLGEDLSNSWVPKSRPVGSPVY